MCASFLLGTGQAAPPGGAPRCARPFSTPDRTLSASPGPEAVPSHAPGMTDAPRDAGPKQAAPARPEKPAADFGYVGIDAILEQMRRKAMKQGFEFNIMVVGERSPRASCRPRAWRAVCLLLGQGLSSPCPPRAQQFSSVAVALLQEPANPASRGLGRSLELAVVPCTFLQCSPCRHNPKERGLGGQQGRGRTGSVSQGGNAASVWRCRSRRGLGGWACSAHSWVLVALLGV